MKILQTVKYYEPSKGGMESVVKDIVNGVSQIDEKVAFTVYSNHHHSNPRREIVQRGANVIIKEKTALFFKSQPLHFTYPSLKKLIGGHDLVHHHYPFPNMELALLRNLDALSRKRFIVTWHANVESTRWSWIKSYYNPLVGKLLDRAESIAVTSPQLYEASTLLRDYEKKVRVIPLSFNPMFEETLEMGQKKYPRDRTFSLLFVGKLRKYKGVEFLVKAIESLDVRLTIVGSGEEELPLKQMVEAMGIEAKVLFLSNIGNEQLVGIYKSSDLFVLPSISEAEAFGVVQLEAMASGLPVVNTRLNSGVPFVSMNEVTGLTVPPGDIEALRGAISRIQEHPALFEHFSKNAIERAREFTGEKMAAAYLDLYRK